MTIKEWFKKTAYMEEQQGCFPSQRRVSRLEAIITWSVSGAIMAAIIYYILPSALASIA